MFRRPVLVAICQLLLVSALLVATPATPVQAKPPRGTEQEQGLSAQEAARRAQAEHGGKVLKVSRAKNGYRVKLLLDSGRVITVTIRD